MTSVLIRLQSSHELSCYEAMSLAMTLATFDNHVQILCELESFSLLLDQKSRLHGMLKSLSLYDMDKAWLPHVAHSDWLLTNINEDLRKELYVYKNTIDLQSFDSVLSFQ